MGAIIGQRLPKLDAPDKATGRTVYGHDVRLPGMLHGRILYSRYPHARIVRVDDSRALNGMQTVNRCDALNRQHFHSVAIGGEYQARGDGLTTE